MDASRLSALIFDDSPLSKACGRAQGPGWWNWGAGIAALLLIPDPHHFGATGSPGRCEVASLRFILDESANT